LARPRRMETWVAVSPNTAATSSTRRPASVIATIARFRTPVSPASIAVEQRTSAGDQDLPVAGAQAQRGSLQDTLPGTRGRGNFRVWSDASAEAMTFLTEVS
jgi:hypothetical protein